MVTGVFVSKGSYKVTIFAEKNPDEIVFAIWYCSFRVVVAFWAHSSLSIKLFWRTSKQKIEQEK